MVHWDTWPSIDKDLSVSCTEIDGKMKVSIHVLEAIIKNTKASSSFLPEDKTWFSYQASTQNKKTTLFGRSQKQPYVRIQYETNLSKQQ